MLLVLLIYMVERSDADWSDRSMVRLLHIDAHCRVDRPTHSAHCALNSSSICLT